jgi:ABC-type uncharacterized transport system ATPase subunit
MELVIDQISKQYQKKWALRDLSLRCGLGLIGLVGPNGAGKTTLARALSHAPCESDRLISSSRPHEAAKPVEPNLEEALLAVNAQATVV